MFRPFRLRSCREIVRPLRGAELLNREVQQERLDSSIVVVGVLKIPRSTRWLSCPSNPHCQRKSSLADS